MRGGEGRGWGRGMGEGRGGEERLMESIEHLDEC